MSDQTNSFFSQAGAAPSGNGVPSTPSVSPAQPPVEQPAANEPITRATLEATLEEFARKMQSSTDKALSSVNKKVAEAQSKANETLEMMKQAGVNLSPVDEANITRKFIDQAYTAPQSAPAPTPIEAVASPQTNDNPIAAMVDNKINSLIAQYGVEFKPQDIADFHTDDPFAFIQEAEKRIVEKARTRAATGLPSGVPTGSAPSSQEALRQAYDAEMAQLNDGKHPTLRGNGADVKSALYAQYIQKGMEGMP